MTPISDSAIVAARTDRLFSRLPVILATHCAAAAVIIYHAIQVYSAELVADWSALLAVCLLISLLTTSFYHRSSERSDKAKEWGALLSNLTIGTAIVFVMGYVGLLMQTTQDLSFPILTTMLMHSAVVAVYSIAAGRMAVSFIIPVIGSVLGAFVYLNGAASYPFTGVVSTFLLLFLWAASATFKPVRIGMLYKKAHEEGSVKSREKLQKAESQLIKDPQTGLFTRRFFDIMVDNEARRSKRNNIHFTIVILEIDHFDDYAGLHGEEQAANLLNKVAKLLTANTSRGGEFVTRFDETKMALLLPNVTPDNSILFITKLMSVIKSVKLNLTQDDSFNRPDWPTISVGMAEASPGALFSIKQVADEALSALHHAKANGGNTYQIFHANNMDEDGQAADLAMLESESEAANQTDAREMGA